MKDSLNDKQETFCQKFALSGQATESARQSGYSEKSAKTTGYKLLQLPIIQERISTLQQEMTTSYNVVEEVEAQYKYAKAHGHTSSALKALDILSKIRGNTPERKTFDQQACHESLVGSFYILGRETIMEMMAEAEALGSQAVVLSQQK